MPTNQGDVVSIRTTNNEAVAMYDSTSGRAFGPIFTNETELDAFLDTLPTDPRLMEPDTLDSLLLLFRRDMDEA